jgi:hypothetical protein
VGGCGCGKFVLGKSATSGAVAVFDYLVASRQPQENAALVMRTMVEGGGCFNWYEVCEWKLWQAALVE